MREEEQNGTGGSGTREGLYVIRKRVLGIEDGDVYKWVLDEKSA